MSPVLLLLFGMAVVLTAILVFRLHAFLALLLGAFSVALLTPGKMAAAPSVVVQGFGATCGKVGILIAMAAIIGKCLLDSGAAQKIVDCILKIVGEARAHLAFLFSGFVLAIPVFFDTVFYLLIPIGKALRVKTGKNYLLYILCIVAGGTMAHSLVPPTPGPLLVAGELGVSIGTMMVGGFLVGMCAVTFGYFYARWMNARFEVPLREDADAGVPEKSERSLPSGFAAFLPILLPVAVIALGTVMKPWADSLTAEGTAHPFWLQIILILGNKNVALTLAAAAALWVLVQQKKRWGESADASKAVQAALMSGAVIILITAAGGAFGGVLRETGIATSIQDWAKNAQTLVLPLVFLVTVLVRTAQGSATVAMITAAPVAKAFLDAGDLAFHPVYLALAVGCGSKPIPWMNDSGFWVITRMSGMKEAETLKFVTPMMSLMGVVGLIVTMLGAWLLPLV